ncbi:unnamed protein product, partial [Polarella glacialis]
MYRFSATHQEQPDFQYSMGQAFEDEALCDYDVIIPIVTEDETHACLANMLKQAGHFRRVLAYCNSIAEALRFQEAVQALGLAAWHINGKSTVDQRTQVIKEFSGPLQQAAHVLVTVQVLGEGVNIPNADTCLFVEPRSSYVSIAQAIGRVLRNHPSKPTAHIIFPAVTASFNHQPVGLEPQMPRQSAVSRESEASSQRAPSNSAEFDGSIHRQAQDDGPPIAMAAVMSERQPAPATQQSLSQNVSVAYQEQGQVLKQNRANPHTKQSSISRQPSPLAAGVTSQATVGKHPRLGQTNSKNPGLQHHSCGGKDQLERFLLALSHADHRLQNSVLQGRSGRLRFIDARAGSDAGPCPTTVINRVQEYLTSILQTGKRWETRFEEVSLFVSHENRLPQQNSMDYNERSLAHWLKNQGTQFRKQGFTGQQFQTFNMSNVPALRALMQQWLEFGSKWGNRCQQLQSFVEKFGRLPDRFHEDDTKVRQLANWIHRVGHQLRVQMLSDHRVQELKATHPLVAEHVNGCISRLPPRWQNKFNDLAEWMLRNNTLPIISGNSTAASLYHWLRRQRSASLSSQQMSMLVTLGPRVAEHLSRDDAR